MATSTNSTRLTRVRRRLAAIATAVAAAALGLGGGGSAPAATTTLYASVGPGYTISLRDAAGAPVTSLAPGTYTIVVDDQAADHNFHLTGPGVDQSTTVAFVGQVTWTVTVSAGTYRFVCDPHAGGMFGDFAVAAADTTPPDTSITSGPSGAVNTTSASLGFSSTEAGSTFQCALDSGSFGACSSPQAYSGLANGTHTFQVRATDAAGNADPTPASRSWTVDTVPPDTSITAGPSGTVGAATVTFSFSSNEAGATFQCALDSTTAYSACDSPKSYGGLAGGAHVFRVKAVDAAGNTDATPAGRSWSIDATPPDTTLTVAPSGAVGTGDASFEFAASEASASFECALDGAPFAACSSPQDFFGLADGAHAFRVRAVDTAGNPDPTPAGADWTVDTTPPETTIDTGPRGAASSTAAEFAFSANEPGSTFECSLDGAAFAECASPRSYAALGGGAHNFQVRATDAVGNADTTPASADWIVDLTAPDTTIDAGPSGTDGSTAPSFGFGSTEPGATFQCSLDGAGFAPCTSPQSYTGLADGGHTFRVKAVDVAGNADPTPATRSWTINSSALYATDGPGYTITFTDAAGAAITSLPSGTYTIIVRDRAADHNFHLLGPGVDRGTGIAAVGEETWSVTFNGGSYHFQCDPHAGGMFGDFTVVGSDATPPETTIDSSPGALANTSSPSFTFSASEAGSTFACSLDEAAYSACTSPMQYTALADGAHTFEVEATDAAGNLDPTPASVTWTIDTAPPDTTITLGPSGTVTSGLATFEFSGDEAGSTFECSLDGAAFAACASPAAYSSIGAGGHTFRVRAVDPAGNPDPSPASRGWTVAGLDTTPPTTTIDSGPTGTVASGSATFTFTASEAGATLECALDAEAFAPCTSPKSYSALADGAHTFKVRATDAAGNLQPTPATRSWTIDTATPDTTIGSGPSGTVASGSASFGFASSRAGATFECSLDGSAFTACTSPKSYTALADGPHTFSVRALAAGTTDPTPASRTWTVALPAEIHAGGLSFDVGSITVPAGPVTLRMLNQSVVWHNIAIRGNGVDVQGPVVGQGAVSSVTADLAPGTYEFYCSVPGHADAGMKGTLTVTGAGGTPPPADTTPTPTGTAPTGTTPAPTGSAGPPPSTDLVASAMSFNRSTIYATAGTVTIRMLNQSPIGHNVAIRGNGVNVEGETVGQGAVSTVSAELKPGTYEFYCSVPGHAAAGMTGTLIVTAPGESPPAATDTTPTGPTPTGTTPEPTGSQQNLPASPPAVKTSCTKLAFTLQGTLVGVAPDAASAALRVRKAVARTAASRKRARVYVGKQATVVLYSKTKLSREGRTARPGDLLAGDRLTVQVKLCRINGRPALKPTASALAAQPSGTLELTATEVKFDKTKLTAKAGKVTITMLNNSPLEHNIAIRGNGVDVEGKVVPKGGTSTVTATLAPGQYEFYCSVPGHAQAGMKGTLTVT